MDFELTDEQVQLAQVARDFVDSQCPPSVPRSVVEGTGGWDDLWKTLVGMEWPGLAIDVDHGGSGASAVELTLVLEELGRGADPTPFLATAGLYTPLVAEVFGDAAGPLLGDVCSGGTGTVAYAADDITAEAVSDGWRLSGTARHVIDGDRADRIAVVATTGTGPRHERCQTPSVTASPDSGVFVVPAADVSARRTPAFDGSLHVAEVTVDVVVPADRSATGAAVATGIDRGCDVALTAVSASTVGACQRILELALEHIVSRKQFGVPIGSFQAVKHMAVDVYVAVQRARALHQFAALTIAEDDTRRRVAASMAKAAAGDAQNIAARHGIQLFGGLGYTWENDLQIFVRRAKAGELLLGGAAYHRAIVARATLADQAAARAGQGDAA